MTSRELEQRLQQLESILKEKDEQYNRLMVDSRRALDLALHAYKVDHYGYIWTYSPDDGLYHKTNMRVATPEIADRAIQTRHLVSKCVTSEKIADKAVTRDKLTDEVINELRMIDIQDMYFGDYYTKEEVEELLKDVDVDLSEYYKKNETYSAAEIRRMVAGLNPDLSGYYTKDDVDRMLRAIRNGRFVPVSALPTASADTLNAIYLVPRESEESEEGNIKDEFITISSGSGENITYSWEKIGSTDIDLSGYAKTSQLFSGDYNDLYNKPEIPEGVDISGKADKIGEPFSTEKPYAEDSYVRYNNKVYKCKTAHEAGPWNAQHFTDVTGNLLSVDGDGNIYDSGKKLSDISWENLKPEGGIQDSDLSDELAQAIGSIPSDTTVGNKVDKVSGTNLTDMIATLKESGGKYGIQSSGKKLSDLALKTDLDGKVGNIAAQPFSTEKSYAVDEYCTKGVANGVTILWKCTTAHQGEWNAQHFEDVTDHILVIGWNGCIKDSGKKVSDFLTEHQSLEEYAKKSEIPTVPDVSGKADKIGVPFDANASYAVDSYVTKDGDLYKCKTAHQGAWLATDFVKVTGNMLTVDGNGNIKDSGKAPFSGSYNDLDNKPTIPDVSYLSGKAKIVNQSATTLNAEVDRYYIFENAISNVTVNLPTPTGEYVDTLCVTFKTAQTGTIAVTLNGTNVKYVEGLSFENDTTYELNCMWNGLYWVVAYAVIVS